ncbi:ABC transporter substrate-binding protein [Pacificimonas flava]|uniref:Oligopeptide ABC transporter, periplasmic oligopeptide-binding protein OppA n=1 Tax=Pacificimonas flava TaxID=1234595 RepID=M2TAA8_9SPHN|nr:ABC transporter substrate-binding protein [Pacificimonas flava]EMD83524.1 Oligopeptide ABC transporter, periplasmic oligopeptide-binding protein OppA [Pacificimonas flava]MBB5278923.1 ABC-type transport system substrate-binding protein [Pacificimonas flava]
MFRRLLLALCLLPIAACEEGAISAADESIRMTFVADEGLHDPAFEGRVSYTVSAAHLGLTARAADGRIVPGLATSWRVLDEGHSYVFKLREAYWPDGRRITSGDVVAVLRRQLSPGSVSPLKPYLMDIEGAIAVAGNRAPPRMLGVADPLPDVVTITLSQENPNLLALLAEPSLAILRSRDDPPPPSGAYRIEREDGAPRALLPNLSWYGADEETPLTPIWLTDALPADDAIESYMKGDTDIVIGGDTAGLRRVQAPDLAPSLRMERTYGFYGYLARTGAGPLADPKVRRALSMAIDREAIINDLFALPDLQAAYGPLPPTLPPAYAGAVPDWSVWTQEARMGEARRLLAEAGIAPDKSISLDVALPQGGETHTEVLNAIAERWAPLGITLRGYTRRPDDHRKAIADGDFDLALIERIAPMPLARYFLRPFRCDVRLGGFCSPEADGLMRQADASTDRGTRIDMTRRAARIIAEEAPILPVFSPVRWALVRPGIGGWEDNISGAHPPRFLTRGS